MTKAYSYLRFSTPEQEKGDSKRRQMDLARRYADAHGLDLDETLTFHDLGVSAFRGDNQDAALGAFKSAVTDGRVPIALRHGVRRAGLWGSLAPNWLHGLHDDRRALRSAVDAALADEMLKDPRGRPDNFHLHSFISKISAACQIFTGKPLTRSVTSETGSEGRSAGKPSGPGIAFVRVCLVPVIGTISDEAIAHGIRQAAKDPRLLR